MSKPATLPRIQYRVVGQDDYMLNIDVAEDGSFIIDAGDYTSHKPVHGAVSPAQMEELGALLAALGEPAEHPAPEDANGFTAELTVGNGPAVRHWRFWEGAMDQVPELSRLVRALEVLG
ncbi:hypothetical protein [Thiohalocapsa sp. ML1]|jgi:hypothetical protein|uniref:hypothetical protein n=1 Tax=Thiohalocapsa sp. ML1 TaxID=1431688 RepID=UPI0020B16E2E|nr:hypothetical protein [Thiohalocapsa sp. ML1]